VSVEADTLYVGITREVGEGQPLATGPRRWRLGRALGVALPATAWI